MTTEILRAGLVDVDLTLPMQMVVFLLFYFVLRLTLFGPVLRILTEREERVVRAKRDAEEFENRAATQAGVYEVRLKDARARALKERDAMRADGAAREREIVGAARADAQTRVEAMKRTIVGQVKSAREALSRDERVLAREVAERLLGRRIDEGRVG
ncbi:MAG: ATP synthase F0 subunit B [Deltaproteobacteria bacterium]|nr:ATP synthase F0 subunit B [Deltaproteobacteria bacterium]